MKHELGLVVGRCPSHLPHNSYVICGEYSAWTASRSRSAVGRPTGGAFVGELRQVEHSGR